MERKEFLKKAGFGLLTTQALMMACKKSEEVVPSSTTNGSCTVTDTETDGPYPLYNSRGSSVQRVDITDGKTGLPLNVTITIKNVNDSCNILANARVDLKRYEGLVKEDSVAEQQLDTQRALVDQLVGTIQADEGQVKTAQVNLVYTHIVAPVTGRVGLRQVDQGNYVTPGDANGIVLINQLQPITVIFNIPEDNVSAVMKRVQTGAPLTVEAFDRTNATKIADGKLLTVDNSIDITTGTVKLRAQFDNTDSSLFPNQFVNIQLLQDVLKDQIIMPNAAVRRGAPNGVATTFVYIVNADSTVSVRPATLGVVDGEEVAVTAGLKAGDVVVTEGGDRLRDGAQVQLPGAAPAPAAGAQPPGKPGAAATPGTRRGKGRGKPPPSP